MILKMAIRELLSHKKRSIITLLLGMFSTALFVFVSAITEGSHKQIIRSSVEIYPGYIEIKNAKFEDEPSFENLIFDLQKAKESLQDISGVESFTSRFETYALYATDAKSVGGMFCAIEPENEAKISRLKSSLVEGEYLKSDDKNALYMGVELAKRLHLKVGDKLSFIATAADYSFAADNLIVKGLFKTKLYEFDNSSAFVNKNYFDTVMRSENIATHIIVNPNDVEEIDSTTLAIQKVLPKELLVQNYKKMMEDLILAMEVDGVFAYITLGIFFIVIFFVIAIFAFLSVYARIRQVGILRAIGTTPRQIVSMLLIEAFILGFISVGIGGAVSAYGAYYFEKNPIELSSVGDLDMEEQMKQYNMVAEITFPTDFNPSMILLQIFIMLLLNLITVIYPIVMINRFTPTEAISYV